MKKSNRSCQGKFCWRMPRIALFACPQYCRLYLKNCASDSPWPGHEIVVKFRLSVYGTSCKKYWYPLFCFWHAIGNIWYVLFYVAVIWYSIIFTHLPAVCFGTPFWSDVLLSATDCVCVLKNFKKIAIQKTTSSFPRTWSSKVTSRLSQSGDQTISKLCPDCRYIFLMIGSCRLFRLESNKKIKIEPAFENRGIVERKWVIITM